MPELSRNKSKILAIIRKKGRARVGQIVPILSISRQRVSTHLRQMVERGILEKSGSTRNAVYFLAKKGGSKVKGRRKMSQEILKLVKQTKGLMEDRVFEEVNLRLGLKRRLTGNVYSILYYAFSEMLNNAIDHSRSMVVSIEIEINRGDIRFVIRDTGIGIWANVQRKFKLSDEWSALDTVLKGKQTTMPERHSGEGIFFTSRIADVFILRSHRIRARFDNRLEDISALESRPIRGTRVEFTIREKSRKNLTKLFQNFTNENSEFDKNEVYVHLGHEDGLFSRSQARRLVLGLEKFKRVLLDFSGVNEVGQAFVDEVFRIFREKNPNIAIDYKNATAAVEFMIRRGLKFDQKR